MGTQIFRVLLLKACRCLFRDGPLEITEGVGGGDFSVHEFFLKPTCLLQDFVFLRHKLCTNFFLHISSFVTNVRFT